MRKTLVAGLVVLAAAGAHAVGAPGVSAGETKWCPMCGEGHGWCVGWDIPTEFIRCEQRYNPDGSPYCVLTGGYCGDWLAPERLAPDGSMRAVSSSATEYRVVGTDAMHPLAVYTVVGCQSFVMARTYEAGEALARRVGTAVIFI